MSSLPPWVERNATASNGQQSTLQPPHQAGAVFRRISEDRLVAPHLSYLTNLFRCYYMSPRPMSRIFQNLERIIWRAVRASRAMLGPVKDYHFYQAQLYVRQCDELTFSLPFEQFFTDMMDRADLFAEMGPRTMENWLIDAATLGLGDEMRSFVLSMNYYRRPSSLDWDPRLRRSGDVRLEAIGARYQIRDVSSACDNRPENTQCAICLEDFSQGACSKLNACGHVLHDGCLDTFINQLHVGGNSRMITCPYCRGTICPGRDCRGVVEQPMPTVPAWDIRGGRALFEFEHYGVLPWEYSEIVPP